MEGRIKRDETYENIYTKKEFIFSIFSFIII